ncbi:hypothetical protein T484DRAFT_1648860 [Baffinella frigidus]|nr:hypothetical protein T484DRAFT_1648860 [Cryptophyta sp. CCMP2293]
MNKNIENCQIDSYFTIPKFIKFIFPFQINLILRFLLWRKPLDIINFKNFNCAFSRKLLNFFSHNLLKKKIFVLFKNLESKIFLDLTYQDYFNRLLYFDRMCFPKIRQIICLNRFRKEYFIKKKPISIVCDKCNSNVFEKVLSRKIYLLSFLFMILLKKKKLISGDLHQEQTKITFSTKGMNFFFRFNDNKGVEFFLELYELFFSNLKKKNSLIKGFYPRFTLIHFNKSGVFIRNKMSINLKDMYFITEAEKNLKKRKFQIFDFLPFVKIYFFHEIKIFFIPRFRNGIFFSHSYDNSFFLNKIIQKKNSHFQEDKYSLQKKNFVIIIESNYRIYVYKKKNVPNSIFLQFSEPLYFLPNLFVGEINERSITFAFLRGINSCNILNFIKKNLHGVCEKIPFSIIQQINIWEMNKKQNYIVEVILIKYPRILEQKTEKIWISKILTDRYHIYRIYPKNIKNKKRTS